MTDGSLMHSKETFSRSYYLIGITGGFGAGKSAVSSIVSQYYPVLVSDDIARDLIESDQGIKNELILTFGREVFSSDGELDRKKLAEIVFSNPQLLKKLNRIVHPKSIKELELRAEELSEEGNRIIFVESALIYEAGLEKAYNYIIAVYAAENIVKKRLMGRFASEDIQKRITSQMDAKRKAERADFCIINESSLEELERNTLFILNIVKSLCVK